MNINFFDWIRAGVKQSVLLGVSDAAVHLGGEKEVDQLNEHFLEALEQNRIGDARRSRSSGSGSRKTRRALGRTLSQVMDERGVQ